MLAYLVPVADPEIAAISFEILVEGIGAEYGAGRNLIALAEGGPALDVHVGLEAGVRANHHILLNDGVFADYHARADDGAGMHSCCARDLRRGVDPRGGRHRVR